MKIAILTSRREALKPFTDAMVRRGLELDFYSESLDVLNALRGQGKKTEWAILIVDELRVDFRRFLSVLMEVNPFLNTAMLTDLSPEGFHEESEGLGVLMALPLLPSETDLQELLDRMTHIGIGV